MQTILVHHLRLTVIFSVMLTEYSLGNNLAIHVPEFEVNDVIEALKIIKYKMTTGPDGVPAFLLRDCALYFGHTFDNYFQFNFN